MAEEDERVEEEAVPAAAEEQAEEQPAVRPLSRREVWSNRLRYFLLGVTIVCIVGVGYLVLTRGVGTPEETVSVPSRTATTTPTVTLTPSPTSTPRPPTETPTPGPTDTPLPPRRHQVGSGETWLGLAIYYDVSLESLLTLNGRTNSDYIQQGETVLIPYPTYTPTPEASPLPTFQVAEELSPEQCREHQVATGETLISIALKYEVSVQLIQSVNNITDPDLVQQGQKLCIPLVTPGPAPSPTFGPSPTPAAGQQYPAPQLLYPPADVEVPAGSSQVTLQWTVAGFLGVDEYYMVEIRNLSQPDARAMRGFVQTTLWRLPDSIRPAAGVIETFAWRVSVVRGEGEPGDSAFRWERTGLPSGWHTFMWMGVAVTPEPTATP